MRLEFRNRHLSITAFPTIELTSFAIILGLNGSGKTHLLQAIQNGSISNSICPTPGNNLSLPPPVLTGSVRLLSNNSLNGTSQAGPNAGPIAETTYSTPTQQSPVPPHMDFEHSRGVLLNPLLNNLEKALNRPLTSILKHYEDPWRLGADELTNRAGTNTNPLEIAAVFKSASDALENPHHALSNRQTFPTHIPHSVSMEILQQAKATAHKLGSPILGLTNKDLSQYGPWKTDQFSFDLATLFGRYRDQRLRNRLQRLEDDERGTTKALSNADFVSVFGRPPWESLNETLAAFSLPYEASTPELNNYTQVRFSLRKLHGGAEVHPSNLSSGEHVLLQFAISSYQHDDGMTNITRPKLLLLDELDAPLHPEMVHRWLSAISTGLVARQGIDCILTTHSPTTVALAPEAALYEMKNGSLGLTKISKQDALNKLTFGVPTLSIDYSGRRQVFCESDTDAEIYERIYSLIKAELSCKRELNFLSTGMRTKDRGEINSGCTIVTNIVSRLRAASNNAVYGIVDWDGNAESTDCVKVIAEGFRDGLENILLDPLLICLLLMKERRAPQGLEDIDRFVGAASLAPLDLQRLVDAIQLAAFPASVSERVDVAFIGGAKTSVLREYITKDDHALEATLVEAFPYLNKWVERRRGGLVKAIVEDVLTEHRTFCPIELKTVFEAIANSPS